MDYPLYNISQGLCIHIVSPGVYFKNGSRVCPTRCSLPVKGPDGVCRVHAEVYLREDSVMYVKEK